MEKIRQEANSFSNFSIGKWWIYAIKIVTVIGLGIMTILNGYNIIHSGYGGYMSLDLNIFGWGMLALCAVGTVILTVVRGKEGYRNIPEETRVKEAE